MVAEKKKKRKKKVDILEKLRETGEWLFSRAGFVGWFAIISLC